MLDGVTFGEFIRCFTLIELAADGASEEAYGAYRDIARILYHIPEGEEVPDLLLLHAPRLFSNTWSFLQEGPIEVNGKLIDFRIIFKSAGSRKADDKTGWKGIAFEVATAGLFGPVSQVEQTDFWTVLLYLYRCKFEYIEEQRNSGKS